MTDIDSPLQRLRDDLVEEESIFILLDGAMLPAMQKVYDYEASPQVCPVYYGTRHEAALDVSPCLYQPSIKSQVWISSEDWREHGVVFSSRDSFQDLLKHLQSLISVTLPSGQLAYWRFYSPAWLASVMTTLDRDEIKKFTGTISQWLVYTEGEWQRYQPAMSEGECKDKEEGWLHISKDHMTIWQQEMKNRFVWKNADKARKAGIEISGEASYESEVSRVYDIAKASGFSRAADIERFIWLALKHPLVCESDEYRAVMQNTSKSPVKRVDNIEAMLHGVREGEVL